MSNDTNIPTSEPSEAVAGATWKWIKSLSDYPASSWTLTYTFLLKTGSTTFTFDAVADGDDHLVDVDEAVTAAYTPGEYMWQAKVTDGTDSCLVDRGCMDVLQDFSVSTADPRPWAQKMADALEATLLGKASRDVMETEINGKKIKRMSMNELRENYTYFKNLAISNCIEASNEDNPAALAEARTLRYTFGRPQ